MHPAWPPERPSHGRTREIVSVAIVLPWAIWAVLRATGADDIYPVSAVMAFTPYAAVGSVATLLAVIAMRAWRVAVVGLAAAAVLVAIVAGRAFPHSQPDDRGPVVTVMAANLHLGTGSAVAVMNAVRRYRVDLMTNEEITPGEVARLRANGLDRALPYGVNESVDGTYGLALWSRTPIVRTGRVEASIPRYRLLLHVVHPNPPILPRWSSTWRQTLAGLPSANFDTHGDLRIIAGDFNATLDDSALRDVIARGYADAAERVGAGLTWTWRSGGPLKITIDHVLVDRRIRVLSVRTVSIPGSDHRALIAVLRLP